MWEICLRCLGIGWIDLLSCEWSDCKSLGPLWEWNKLAQAGTLIFKVDKPAFGRMDVVSQKPKQDGGFASVLEVQDANSKYLSSASCLL